MKPRKPQPGMLKQKPCSRVFTTSPLLAFFGTRGDVGNEADLELLKSSIKRQPSGPRRVDTVMIRGADHMYAGEEEQVAETIANWADTLLQPEPPKGITSSK